MPILRNRFIPPACSCINFDPTVDRLQTNKQNISALLCIILSLSSRAWCLATRIITTTGIRCDCSPICLVTFAVFVALGLLLFYCSLWCRPWTLCWCGIMLDTFWLEWSLGVIALVSICVVRGISNGGGLRDLRLVSSFLLFWKEYSLILGSSLISVIIIYWNRMT